MNLAFETRLSGVFLVDLLSSLECTLIPIGGSSFLRGVIGVST